jgi:hypothetical protein
MIGKFLWRNEPGYCGKISFLNVFAKLVQDVAFGNLRRPFFSVIGI